MKKLMIAIALMLAVGMAWADFVKPPAASVRALKVTRGKPIKTGVVFIDGEFIKPPYVVERYGTVIRVNNKQATNQLLPWEEFLKTQAGAKVSTSSTEVAGGEELPADDDAGGGDDLFAADDDDPLADLFGDEPKPKKAAPKKAAPKKKPAGPRVVTTTKVEFDGTFEPNEKTDAMVAKLNKYRTGVSEVLARGGLVAFYSEHSRTTAGAAQAKVVMKNLPDCMRDCRSVDDLESMARGKGLSFLPHWFFEGVFRNRTNYIELVNYRKQMDEDEKIKALYH